MTEEYKYRPPLTYLFIGLGGLALSIVFGMAIEGTEILFSIIIGIFCLMTLALGIGFISLFLRRFKIENLKLGSGYIEIPGRWSS